MPCKGCDEKKTSNRYTAPIGVSEGEPHKHEHPHHKEPQDPRMPPYDELFQEVNQYSLNTLLEMRTDIRVKEEKHFKEMLKFMSDEVIALKIVTFAKIFNGEEFSQEGHSPKYCLEMLNAMLDYEQTAKVFSRFEGLEQQVREKYKELKSSQLNIQIK